MWGRFAATITNETLSRGVIWDSYITYDFGYKRRSPLKDRLQTTSLAMGKLVRGVASPGVVRSAPPPDDAAGPARRSGSDVSPSECCDGVQAPAGHQTTAPFAKA